MTVIPHDWDLIDIDLAAQLSATRDMIEIALAAPASDCRRMTLEYLAGELDHLHLKLEVRAKARRLKQCNRETKHVPESVRNPHVGAVVAIILLILMALVFLGF